MCSARMLPCCPGRKTFVATFAIAVPPLSHGAPTMQSSLNNWLKKPIPAQQPQQPPHTPPLLSPKPSRPPPPPKSGSAPTRVSPTPVHAPPTPAPTPAVENWNDIPDEFLQAPSRPRSKKSPRSSRAVTPASSRMPTPITLPTQKPAIPQLFALRPLPSSVQLVPLTEDLLPGFKRLNTLTLPISYPESFYKETMTEPHHGITLVAVWHSYPANAAAGSTSSSEKPQLVGAVRCRLLPSSQLYISTIGVLAPYRSHGIAMHLLQAIVKKAVELHSVRSVTAHVWEANEEGLEWYKKRNFETLDKEQDYYRKLRPQGAFLMRKWIGVGDLLADSAAQDDVGNST
ncbi:acyl-CoA N-acyltransferase [Decorospora gaudefroyi]|uniref:Acyl-CoA N-acyltransferase n=1 Tax=Decorospora gaudefroyi TaxID=184978 RepID=A0A6A5KE54_9PLEO|nr:acyl-CoA N-acyltransferase [Decorospora gaudefroyi]